jgi:hypothetical protein
MRNHLGKASVAQSLDGEPSGGEPAFPPDSARYIESCVNSKVVEGRVSAAGRRTHPPAAGGVMCSPAI